MPLGLPRDFIISRNFRREFKEGKDTSKGDCESALLTDYSIATLVPSLSLIVEA